MELDIIYNENCLDGIEKLPDESIDLVITSPPYKNSYEGIGTNKEEKITKFHYSNDVGEPLYTIEDAGKLLIKKIKKNGVLLLNLGYNKDSGALRPFYIIDRFLKSGWFCPDLIIWHKKNPIPNTAYQLTNAIEFFFILTKIPTYKLKIKKREYIHNVFKNAISQGDPIHSATFPIDLIKQLIRLFSNKGDIILDPFIGLGTTAIACKELERHYIGFEIKKTICQKELFE